jgi:5-(aminomethyl)-3-furanmethanol phosphate kinase
VTNGRTGLKLTVVKLGGSHALSPLLGRWLGAIGRAAGQVVVVPGGGPFADAVRAAQPAMRFGDHAAHDMALMAMAQFGRALASLADGFVYADTLDAVREAVGHGEVPVWSPWPMLRAHPDIPRSWDVTSDSLAVWLAAALDARRVVLIKHRTPLADRSPSTLAGDGLVDAAFPHFTARFDGAVLVAGPDDLADASALFGGQSAAVA